EDHWLRVNIDEIADSIGWSQSFDLVVKFDEGEMVTPEGFDQLTGLFDWIETLPEISEISGPMPIINDCLAMRTPPFEGPIANVPPKMLDFCVRSSFTVSEGDTPAFFNQDFTKLHVKVLLKKLSSAGVRKVTEQIESESADRGFEAGAVQVSGMTVMSAYLSQVNTYNMLVGSAFAMFVVSVLIGLFLRSPVLALLSILPNFLPAMSSLGLWVWINGEVGMAASIIAAVTFGIVVDDTIHILYALARGKNTATRNGVKRVLRNVTPGVLTTTATLGLGFSMLIFSGFQVNKQLGFLTGMTIWIAFLFDIFVLPGLYTLLKGKRR
ncbi:MAG TPA: MMPL family transporter, partial [Paracoccaceae bacterium]|nr:MMPL family transporter [Paracoccaceae bacterium]